MPARRAMSMLCAATALTALAGCTPDRGSAQVPSDAPPPPPPLFTEIEVPHEVRPWKTRAHDPEILPPTETQRGLVVAIATDPGATPALKAWSLRPGETTRSSRDQMPVVDLGVELPGEVTDVELAASASLTAIVGTTWADGITRPFVLASSDRESWTAVPVTVPLEQHDVGQVAATGGSVFATVDGGRTLGVLTVRDGLTALTALPTDDGSTGASSGIAARGSDVVVVGTVTSGGTTTPVAWLSTDGGASFARAPITDEGLSPTGVVRAGESWVVTGTAVRSGKARPMAWSSEDGAHWSRDRTDWVLDGERWASEHGYAVGLPVAGPRGTVHVWVSPGDAPGDVLVRTTDGRWAPQRAGRWVDDLRDEETPATLAVPKDGPTFALHVASGWIRVDTEDAEDTGRWRTVRQIVEDDGTPTVDVGEDGARLTVTLRATMVTVAPEHGWMTQPSATVLALADDSLEPVPLPRGRTSAHTATDPTTGVQVSLSYREMSPDQLADDFEHEAAMRPDKLLASEVRASDGSTAEGKVDLGDGYLITDVRHLAGHGFIATMLEMPYFDDDISRFTAFTSPDGATWTRARASSLGTPEGTASQANGICALPDGPVVVVGWSGPDQTSWTFDGAAWTHHTPLGLPDGSWFDSCFATPSEVIAVVRVDDTTQLWRTSDGRTFTPAGAIPGRAALGSVTTDGSTYVAPGRVATATYEGPVLWMSRDALSWAFVPLGMLGNLDARIDDGSVVVAVSSPGGPHVLRGDIERLWATATPAAGEGTAP